MSRPFLELFPSLLLSPAQSRVHGQRAAYYLARQGKDLYDFRLDHVYYSDALDAAHEIPGVFGQRVSAGEKRLARMVRGLFPASAVADGVRVADRRRAGRVGRTRPGRGIRAGGGGRARHAGLHPAAHVSVPPDGRARGLRRAAPAGDGPACSSRSWWPTPMAGLRSATEWSLDGAPVQTLELASSPRPVRLHLLVPAALATRDTVRVGLVTARWRDPYRGREVGLHVGAQWLLAQRLAGPAAVQAAAARVQAECRAEDRRESWWVAAPGVHLASARFPSALDWGPGDEDQLGPGWFWREAWGKPGTMRWTAVGRGLPRPRRPRDPGPGSGLLGRGAPRSRLGTARRRARGARRRGDASGRDPLRPRARHVGRARRRAPRARRRAIPRDGTEARLARVGPNQDPGRAAVVAEVFSAQPRFHRAGLAPGLAPEPPRPELVLVSGTPSRARWGSAALARWTPGAATHHPSRRSSARRSAWTRAAPA